MNNKAQISMILFMLAVVIIILAIAFIYPIYEGTTNASNSMTCSTTTDDFVKAACWVADLNMAYFIGGIIAMAGVMIGAKLVIS